MTVRAPLGTPRTNLHWIRSCPLSDFDADALMPPAHPFDDDKLKEECGIFGVLGTMDAANFVALGLHALQHRGQEAGGIVSYDPDHGFNSARRFGYVRDNFTSQKVMETLPGALSIGHVR